MLQISFIHILKAIKMFDIMVATQRFLPDFPCPKQIQTLKIQCIYMYKYIDHFLLIASFKFTPPLRIPKHTIFEVDIWRLDARDKTTIQIFAFLVIIATILYIYIGVV